MDYEVRFTRTAEKSLRRFGREDQERVLRAAGGLAEDPRPPGARAVKGTPFMRLRVGSYRIVYEVRDEELLVLVIRIGHWREVYRNL